MQCVILAGGLGTRMRSLTGQLPKTLVPVGGEPFAHYQLAWLARHGVRDVVYSIAFQGEMIRDYVGNGSRWGLSVRFVEDGKELLGTGGALRRALDSGHLADSFGVLYGDSFLPFDFRLLAEAFQVQSCPALMAVFRNDGRWDNSNVRFADGIVHLYQKFPPGQAPPEMNYIDYGASMLRRELIAECVAPGLKNDLADVYHQLSRAGRLAGLEVTQRFYEVGSPSGLRDFELWLRENPVHAWPSP